MAKIAVLDMAGKQVSERELSDAVFAVTPNEAVMHAMVVNYLANQRQGTQSTLTRTEVAGGGRKPWRQKLSLIHISSGQKNEAALKCATVSTMPKSTPSPARIRSSP